MNIFKTTAYLLLLCMCFANVAGMDKNEIRDTNDTWLYGNEDKGKDIINSLSRTISEIGNISYKEINSNPDRLVIGFDTDEFVTPYKKYFNKIILTKEKNGVDLKISLQGAQFVAKDPAVATSGNALMYLAAASFRISFSKPVNTAGVVIRNIQDQDWVVYFYNGKDILKEEKVEKSPSKSVFVAYQSDKSNITHVWLKRTNKESKKAGYVDDIAIVL